MIEDAARFQMDAASLARLSAALDVSPVASDDEGLWPEHVEVVEAFLLVATQWRVAPISHGMSSVAGGFTSSQIVFVGLDYSAARTALEANGVAITRDLWRGLQTMEFAAIAALNKAQH